MTRLLTALAVLAAITPLATGHAKSHPIGPEAALAAFQFSSAQIETIRAGEIVLIDLPPQHHQELHAAAAMLLPVPYAQARAWLLDPRSRHADFRLIAFRPLQVPIDRDDWNDLGGIENGLPNPTELRRLAAARPGSTFNLSTEEYGRLSQRSDAASASAEGIASTYADILRQRFEQYVAAGLAGIGDYDRGDGRRLSPARELRIEDARFEQQLGALFPDFAEAVRQFPKGGVSTLQHRYYWKSVEIEGRPASILLHQMFDESRGCLVLINREFFVGHTYTSLQQFGLLVPAGDQSLLVFDHSTSTDRLGGTFGGVARWIAEKRVRDSLETYLRQVRKHVGETHASKSAAVE